MLQTLPSLEPHPCSVSLALFEGPLDLLLHLVEQSKLDITAISLVQVTDQYLVYMRAEDRIDHRALADFVAIGARLIYLKSRALLPAPPTLFIEEEDVDADDLVEMLLQYQRFKEIASLLREREETGVRAFPRMAQPPNVPALPGLSPVTLDRLLAIVQKTLARTVQAPEPEPLKRPEFTVSQKIAEIEFVLRVSGRISFSSLIEQCQSRDEIITVFFAALELIKQGAITARQDRLFGEIGLVVASGIRAEPPELEAEFAGVKPAVGV